MKDEKEPLEQKQKDSVRINIRTGGLLYFFCVQTVGGEEI